MISIFNIGKLLHCFLFYQMCGSDPVVFAQPVIPANKRKVYSEAEKYEWLSNLLDAFTFLMQVLNIFCEKKL